MFNSREITNHRDVCVFKTICGALLFGLFYLGSRNLGLRNSFGFGDF